MSWDPIRHLVFWSTRFLLFEYCVNSSEDDRMTRGSCPYDLIEKRLVKHQFIFGYTYPGIMKVGVRNVNVNNGMSLGLRLKGSSSYRLLLHGYTGLRRSIPRWTQSREYDKNKRFDPILFRLLGYPIVIRFSCIVGHRMDYREEDDWGSGLVEGLCVVTTEVGDQVLTVVVTLTVAPNIDSVQRRPPFLGGSVFRAYLRHSRHSSETLLCTNDVHFGPILVNVLYIETHSLSKLDGLDLISYLWHQT